MRGSYWLVYVLGFLAGWVVRVAVEKSQLGVSEPSSAFPDLKGDMIPMRESSDHERPETENPQIKIAERRHEP